MVRRRIAAVLFAVVVLGAVAGCGGTPVAPAEDTVGTPPQGQPPIPREDNGDGGTVPVAPASPAPRGAGVQESGGN